MFVGWSHENRHFGHLRLGPVHVFFPVLVEDVVADGCVDSESPVLVSMATVSMAEVSEAQVGEVCSAPVDTVVTVSEEVVVAWLQESEVNSSREARFPLQM